MIEDTEPVAYLVWVRGITDLQPQIWSEIDYGIGNWKKHIIVSIRKMSDQHAIGWSQRKLGLDELKQIYPPKKEDVDRFNLLHR